MNARPAAVLVACLLVVLAGCRTAREIAWDAGTSPEKLRELASHEDRIVRTAVGENPNTPPDVLQVLARDSDELVRASAADKPGLPVDLLTQLASDEELLPRQCVAINPSVPPEVLRELSVDEEPSVRRMVARNPSTPRDVLEALFADPETQASLGRHPEATAPMLQAAAVHLCSDGLDHVDLGTVVKICQNPRTTEETLALISRALIGGLVADEYHTEADVRRRAEEDVIEELASHPRMTAALLEDLKNAGYDVAGVQLASRRAREVEGSASAPPVASRQESTEDGGAEPVSDVTAPPPPPLVRLLTPPTAFHRTRASSARIRVEARHLGGNGSALIKKNGVKLSPPPERTVSEVSTVFTWIVDLDQGENEFEIIALGDGGAESKRVEIFYDRPAITPTGNYRALIIANWKYEDPSLGWKKLETPARDARALEELLETRYGFDDIVFRENVNRAELYRALRSLIDRVEERDNVLVLFAGHGYYDDVLKTGYWVPVDGQGPQVETLMSNHDIRNLVATLSRKSRHVLLLSDSCFSGNLLTRGGRDLGVREREGFRGYYRKKGELKSCQVIASGGNEKVDDDFRGTGHSPFAYFLIQALEANNEPYLSTSELSLMVEKAVANAAFQTPRYGRLRTAVDTGGEFFFVNR